MGDNNIPATPMNVTLHHLIVAILVILFLFVPMFLFRMYPDNYWVITLFGGYRVFIFYGVVFGGLFFIEKALLHNEKYKKSSILKELGK